MHFCVNKLLNPSQSGFRPNDSTTNQLLSIVHTVFSSFDCSPPMDVRSVYLDISKAFDRVWHESLIYKLRSCGVSGNLLSLLQSFLDNRKQCTVLNGRASKWGSISAGVPQGSILGPLFFLVYINDLTATIRYDMKLFADDTSLFRTANDLNQAAADMNHDLNSIRNWARQWRMLFNPDPMKQAVEITFSTKRNPINHPVLKFNNVPVAKVDEHKHLGMILDSKMSFASHIQVPTLKCRRGIGMIKYLSTYLPRKTLEQLYKSYVRPHLDYGDVIYHVPHNECELSHTPFLTRNMEKLEQIQYSAALAITGAWKGTSREKLYDELGWESLNMRRWSRRLILFYKILNNITPDYTSYSIPQLKMVPYSFRKEDVVGQIRARTSKLISSFYPHCLSEWNKLDPSITSSPSPSNFKIKLLKLIRPLPKPVYSIYDPIGLAILTQLRVGLSKLNSHKFRHNFRETINPMCPSNDGIEDTEHYLLLCRSYVGLRCDLLASVAAILQLYSLSSPSFNQELVKVILYGDERLPLDLNKKLLEATLKFIFMQQNALNKLFLHPIKSISLSLIKKKH